MRSNACAFAVVAIARLFLGGFDERHSQRSP